MADLHEIVTEWDPVAQVYSVCTECGEPAWGHPNADRLGDVRAAVRALQDRTWPPPPPRTRKRP